MQRNRRHFGQAAGTPFTTSPLAELINWEANSMFAELVLQGNFSSDELDDISTLLLRHCQSVVPPDSIPATLTMDQFLGKLRVWNENTSTSPSGRHLGHYKALLRSLPADDPDFDTQEEQRFALLQAHLDVLNYCLIHGYVLSRWKNIVNVMILKEPGNTKIHRLRVIHIYEADYNLILSVKWRQLMKHAEAHKLIHDGQFGGRPGREAIGLTLLEELKNDISHLSRKALVNRATVETIRLFICFCLFATAVDQITQ